MGYEGFSSSWHPLKMHPVHGNRGEFLALGLLFSLVLMMKQGRRKNEDGMRSEYGFANNRYAHLTTQPPSQL